ncbi:MAG: hypothetical protein AMS22_08065 [Thiotrichales bacterium SG8_50]|nr:MAG: hypothetical protein AMS22_08065 [Thiotrichales bacterium SG8_50]
MRNQQGFVFLLAGLIILSSGCASWESDKGVETLWRQTAQENWQAGKTSDKDVIEALGPPSQIITLGDQSVYYYLHEKNRGKGYIFILWNQTKQVVEYDRAVFFFDKKGALLKYAYSKPISARNAK